MDFSALIPVAGIFSGVAIIWIGYKFQELKVTSRKAAAEAAREAEEKRRLETRLAVLERIVTDRGIETADQIAALREAEPEALR